MMEAVLDAQEKLAAKYYWNKNWEADRVQVMEKTLPPIYSNLQAFFNDSNNGPWVLGENISVADFSLWCFLDLMTPFVPDALPGYSQLSKFYSDFSAREKVANYLKVF